MSNSRRQPKDGYLAGKNFKCRRFGGKNNGQAAVGNPKMSRIAVVDPRLEFVGITQRNFKAINFNSFFVQIIGTVQSS